MASVPLPDGRQLAWTSSRGGGREGQIFLASWNHEKALALLRRGAGAQAMKCRAVLVARLIAIAPLLWAGASAPAAIHAQSTAPRARHPRLCDTCARGAAGIGGVRWDVRPALHGERLAADYIAGELKQIGARPLPGHSDMFMPFEFTAGSRDGGSHAGDSNARMAA
jgi:hypothetical protein